MRLNRLKKSLTEYTDDELLAEARKLRELLNRMVGRLYPPMVRSDINEIASEQTRRRTHGRHGRPGP